MDKIVRLLLAELHVRIVGMSSASGIGIGIIPSAHSATPMTNGLSRIGPVHVAELCVSVLIDWLLSLHSA